MSFIDDNWHMLDPYDQQELAEHEGDYFGRRRYNSDYASAVRANKERTYLQMRADRLRVLLNRVPNLTDDRLHAAIAYQSTKGCYPEYLKELKAEKERRSQHVFDETTIFD